MKIRHSLLLLLLILFLSCNEKINADTASASGNLSEGSEKITFIELGSVNCIPCRAMVPVMEQMEKELGDQVDVVFHDVWTEEGKPYAQQHRIRVIPTQIFLDKNGSEYYRHEGYFPAEELYPILEKGGVNLP